MDSQNKGCRYHQGLGWGLVLAMAVVGLMAAEVRAEPARQGIEATRVSFASEALGRAAEYLVWQSPGRAADGGRAVIVALHGLGGSGADWFDPQRGRLGEALERAVRAGVIEPLVVVAPDGGNGYWTDHVTGEKPGYGRFIDEVLADLEGRMAFNPKKVAIVGASMGGHGAWSRAWMAPGRYVAAVSLSGALFDTPPSHRKVYKRVWGSPADLTHWAQTAPSALITAWPGGRGAPMGLYLSYGESEGERFQQWNQTIAALMDQKKISYRLVTRPGGHTWATWRAETDAWVRWLAPWFQRAGGVPAGVSPAESQ